jgi:hypothetical protein
MSRRMVDIEARFGEADKLVQLQLEREKRLFKATAEFYAQQEKAGIEGLAPLLEKLGGRAESLADFFKTQQKVALDRVKAVTPLLQLSKEEIQHFELVKRATILIDPCSLVPHGSPVWKCVFAAASCGSTHSETANATGACTCAPSMFDNHIEARVEAYGQGQNGWRSATAEGWLYFDIPARSAPTNVQVHVFINVHGFYIVRRATGSASFNLTLKIEGFQYGYSWNSKTLNVLNISADSMGRQDSSHLLEFTMPVGADPFTVRVSAKLTATAKTGGAMAVGDFSTGAGNYIETIYCNTYG